jgi:hypothetical protein
VAADLLEGLQKNYPEMLLKKYFKVLMITYFSLCHLFDFAFLPTVATDIKN